MKRLDTYARSSYPIVLVLLLLGCKVSFAQSTENALLWKIIGKNITKPSYLFGTIHMICPEDLKLGDSLLSGMERADRLYLEIDMDEPGLMLKTMKLTMLEKGTLKELMDSDDYKLLENFMKNSIGMPMMLLNRMKPFTLLSLIYSNILPCKKPASYEEALMGLAKKQKKEVMGLESMEDQMAVFDRIPDTAETRMIMDLIRDVEKQRFELQHMIDAYKRRDLTSLAAMISDAPEMDGFEDLLLVNRNRKWIPIMTNAMRQQSCLFAVGAGHLPGIDGVINLLRQSGYTVQPVE